MKLGVESFTMFKDFFEDFHGTMKKVSDLGLHYVEFLARISDEDHGMGLGLSPQEAVKIFDDYGMKLTGCIFVGKTYIGQDFDMDEMQKIIDWYAEAGCTAIGLANDYFIDPEFFKKRMDAYNELGARCKKAGMVWTYHNHFHEQQKIGDKTILELMCEMTDDDTVGFDWDVFWGCRGGIDPVEFQGQQIVPLQFLAPTTETSSVPTRWWSPATLSSAVRVSFPGRRLSIRPMNSAFPTCSWSRTTPPMQTSMRAWQCPKITC